MYFSWDDLRTAGFSKSRYIHLSNSQCEKELRAGRIELLDPERRIYRSVGPPDRRRFFIASSANGSGAVSMEISRSIQNLLAAEITGTRAISLPGE